jgi:hypothetical protein
MASQTGRNGSGELLGVRHCPRPAKNTTAPQLTRLFIVGGILLCGLSLGGCPGSSPVTPIIPGSSGTGAGLPATGTGSGNAQPVVTFLEPLTNVELSPGDTTTITWTVSDTDSNPQYALLLDPDSVPNNGNEIVLAQGFASDLSPSGQTILLQTTGLNPGTYLVRCTASDGVNPTVAVTSAGQIRLFPAGLQHKNRPPFIVVTEPSTTHGVVQGDVVPIAWCGRDPDDTAKILILLDYDDNPDNDVVFHTKAEVNAICNGTLPRQVNGAILLKCEDENGCTDPANGNSLNWTVDVSEIPPRPDGQPYRVRADITDMTADNPTLHSYAPGGVMVLPIVNTAIVDVGQIGRTLGGAVFQGFDAGGRLGQAFTRVPDLNADGTDEFLMVAQYGHPYERGAVGSAFMVFGRPLTQPTTQPTDVAAPGSRFAGLIPVSSIGTTIQGITFTGPHCETTEGITNVSYIPDLDGDGKVELLFGMPRIQAFPDAHDDNPCGGNPPNCYAGLGKFGTDMLPNPLAVDGYSPISVADFMEGTACADPDTILCSTDGDLATSTPIISGYMFYESSQNLVDAANNSRNVYVGLEDAGLRDGPQPNPGAVFRGAWYDFDYSQVDWPYAIVPTTRFGETVASMPPLSTGWDEFYNSEIPSLNNVLRSFGASFLYFDNGIVGYGNAPAKDIVPELLISAPMAQDGRGNVVLTFGQNFDQLDPGTDRHQNSIPHYYDCGGCPSTCYKSRCLLYPGMRVFTGAAIGDHLGYGWSAGDFNLDGNQDILMGAPGASRDGITGNGILYILFGRVDIGNVNFAEQNPPRVEIHGMTAGEGLGAVNRLLDDMNGDSLPDVVFGSPNFAPNGLPDAGEVGVIFGGRQLTGENIFNELQVATTQLPGVRFLGTQQGGLAGSRVSSAGDFNGDGFTDLLIVAPNETRAINGQVRRGIVYLIFGGRHLYNQTFLLSQVGTTQLPGMIFVSPFAVGTADEAALESAEGVGDVDGDGFADIMIGAPAADYVDPAAPSQRRVDAGEAYLIYGTNDVTLIGQ